MMRRREFIASIFASTGVVASNPTPAQTAAGDLVWSYEISDGTGSGATVIGESVYIGDYSGNLWCLDKATGDLNWQNSNTSGYIYTPQVQGDYVYYGSDADNYIYAVNKSDGTEAWKTPTDGGVTTSPNIYGGKVYFGTNGSTLYSVDRYTGNVEWTFTNPSDIIYSEPLVTDSRVFFGDDHGDAWAINRETGNLDWSITFDSYSTSNKVRSGPAYDNGIVYFNFQRRGDFSGYDIETGQKLWTFNNSNRIYFPNSAPTIHSGSMYVHAIEGNTNIVYLFSIDLETGDIEWQTEITGGHSGGGSPTIVDGTVYIATDEYDDGRIMAFDANDGGFRWQYDVGEPMTSPPIVSDGKIFVGGSEDPQSPSKVRCLETSTSRSSEGTRVSQRVQNHTEANPGLNIVYSPDRFVTNNLVGTKSGSERKG